MGGGVFRPRVESRIRSTPGSARADRSPNDPRTGSSQTRTSESNFSIKFDGGALGRIHSGRHQTCHFETPPGLARHRRGSRGGGPASSPALSIDTVVAQAVKADI